MTGYYGSEPSGVAGDAPEDRKAAGDRRIDRPEIAGLEVREDAGAGRREVALGAAIRGLESGRLSASVERGPVLLTCQLELFARGGRPSWITWGNQAEDYEITWKTYPRHSLAAE